MGELCDKLFLTYSTATDLVDRMENHGYVTRQRDPEDRRSDSAVYNREGASLL